MPRDFTPTTVDELDPDRRPDSLARRRRLHGRRDGRSALEYAPYYLFGLLSPLVLFAMAATGRGVPSTGRAETAQAAD